MKKRAISMLLIAMIVGTFAGCGSPPDESSIDSGENIEEESEENEESGESPNETAETESTMEKKMYDTTEFYSTVEEYTEATGNSINSYGEAPSLAEQVAAGELPTVEERISSEPMVVIPLNEVGTYGGRIRTAATSLTTGSAETWTGRTQGLLTIGSDLSTIVPNIAKGYEYNEDCTELTIYLREGMKWSDGEDFNADDFQFYYDAILCNDDILPSKPSQFMSGGEVMQFTKVSDYEIKYTFAEPNPSIVVYFAQNNRMYLSVPFAPEHYLSQYHIQYNENAGELAKELGYATWVECFLGIYPDEVQGRLDTNLPCVDPWVLTSVDDIGNKFFERNPYYWKVDTEGNQLPYIDGQDRLLYDRDTINIKMLAGEFDVGLQFTNLNDYQLYQENAEANDYRVDLWTDTRGQVLLAMRFNLDIEDENKKALFNNLAFREGISVAINRDEINEVMWKGLAVSRKAIVSPTVSFYEEWMGEAVYNPELAEQKFDEAGLGWDANHQYRTYEDGSVVELNLIHCPLDGDVKSGLEMMKNHLEAVGIKTNVQIIDQTLYSEKYAANELDFWIWNLDSGTEFGFYSYPMLYGPDANEYGKYIDSNGIEGIEPSDEYTAYYKLSQEFQKTLMGTDKYTELGTELLTMISENYWNIGIAGLVPQPVIIKNGLKNTPELGVYDYDYRYWMIFHPEQWYWAE